MMSHLTRRGFLLAAAGAPPLLATLRPSVPANAELRQNILDTLDYPRVALHRAQVFTRVFQQTEGKPWEVRKAMAFREHLRTVPLYLRPGDRLAGSISETPGAMSLTAELGFGEIGTDMNPKWRGYLKGKVPPEIFEYWKTRNMYGKFLAENPGQQGPISPDSGRQVNYKFLSNQGHLSPSYSELLKVGFGGLIKQVRERKAGEKDPEKLAFLTAAEESLSGVSEWIRRYSEFLKGDLARIAAKVSTEPPSTFVRTSFSRCSTTPTGGRSS
ncbi:MAG: hypothetical protein M1541_17080 [Acidobacteria bacterium]|nr:hypothetical protein [Acidobacteriota bacterium]